MNRKSSSLLVMALNSSASSNATARPPLIPRTCANSLYLCNPTYRAWFSDILFATSSVNIPLCLMAALGNGLVFAAYYHSQSLRRPVFTILMFVAATDFLTGAVGQPLYVFAMLRGLTTVTCPYYVCTLNALANTFMIFLIGATMINLFIITIDRYIAVFHSFQYEEIVTHSRVVKVLLLLWSAWLSAMWLTRMRISFIPTINQMIGILITLDTISICVMYFKVLKEVRRIESNVVVPANQPQKVKEANERKTAVTVSYILGALLVCFLPMLFALFVLPQILNSQGAKARYFPTLVFHIATTLYLANSTLNVFIYGWKNQEMRTAMLKVFRMVKQKFQSEVSPLN